MDATIPKDAVVSTCTSAVPETSSPSKVGVFLGSFGIPVYCPFKWPLDLVRVRGPLGEVIRRKKKALAKKRRKRSLSENIESCRGI